MREYTGDSTLMNRLEIFPGILKLLRTYIKVTKKF